MRPYLNYIAARKLDALKKLVIKKTGIPDPSTSEVICFVHRELGLD